MLMLLQKKIHRLAGSGGGYGLQELSEFASKIEKLCEDENFEQIEQVFNSYINYLQNIELEF